MSRPVFWFYILGILAISACKVDHANSRLKEFEFSSDICREIQQAVDKRWAPGMGMSKAAYHSQLVNQETQIIAYELPRYQRRVREIKSNKGPANGPTGNEKLLSSETASSAGKTNIMSSQPKSQPLPSKASSVKPSTKSGSLSLTDDSGQMVSPRGGEVCPGCDKSMIERRLASLEKNERDVSKCVYRDGANSTNSTSVTDPDQGLSQQEKAERAAAISQMQKLIYAATQPKELCVWFGRWSAGSGSSRDRCKGEVVESFCKEFVDVGTSLGVDAINGKTTSGNRIATQVVKPIPNLVKSTMIACAQQWAYDKMKDALRDRTFGSLSQAVRDQAKGAIVSDKLGPEGQAQKIAELKKNIALAVCKAGAGMIASQIDAAPEVNYDNPCAAIWQVNKSRIRACLNTTASGCRIAAGDIDVRNFLPEGVADDRPLATLTAEAVNTISGMGCKSIKADMACATISEAASQIRSAILTGNNDWAHCAGTDQAGACAGTLAMEYWLGVKNSDFKEPIRQAEDVGGVKMRDYCVCDHSCFEDDWAADTQLAAGKFADLIHANDAGVRDCNRLNGRWGWMQVGADYIKSANGFNLYWKTSNCQIRKLRNESFVPDKPTEPMSAEVQVGSGWERQKFYFAVRPAICQNRY